MAGKPGIIGRAFRISCFCGKWAVLATLVPALAIAAYVFVRIDDEIRQHVEQKLSGHYRHLHVRVDSAQLLAGRGIAIRGIRLSSQGDDANRPLLEIDELLLVCEATVRAIVQDELEVRRIVVRSPKLRAHRHEDGTWNVARLTPLPKFGDSEPDAIIEGGEVEITDASSVGSKRLKLRDLRLHVSPRPASAGLAGATELDFQGTTAGDFFQRLRFGGEVDPDFKHWNVAGEAEGLAVGPEMLESIPWSSEQLEVVRALRAEGELAFRAAWPHARKGVDFAVDGRLHHGRFDDHRLPYALTDLEAEFHASPESLELTDLHASHGHTTVTVSAHRAGLAEGAPAMVQIDAKNVQVNRDTVLQLPETIQSWWRQYLPEGQFDASCRLVQKGGRWEPELVAHLTNMSFSYHRFPYPLDRAIGTLRYVGDLLSIDISARSGPQPVELRGEIHAPGPAATGWVEITGQQIPIDARLLGSLPEETRGMLQMLRPTGSINVDYRGWKDAAGGPLHKRLRVRLNGCSTQYERFPYPLYDITGTMEMENDRWTFRNLQGSNDSGFVTCEGGIVPTADGGGEMTLHFAGADVPLEKELRGALHSGARRLWDSLKPRGSIDLTSTVKYRSGDRHLELDIRVAPTGDSVSIEPQDFPYRLERIGGQIHFHNNRMDLINLRGQHGRTKLSTGGQCRVRKDGSWVLELDRLAVDRLRIDRDLLIALPSDLRQALTKLDPSGPVNLRGRIVLARAAQQDAPLTSAWDLALTMHRGTLQCGVVLSDIYGEVRLNGNFDGQRFITRGEVALDSVTYNELQFTEVMGPLWIDNQQALFGAWADKQRGPQARHMTAKLYSGTLVGDGWIAFDQRPKYHLQAALSDADLARMARESLGSSQKLKGQLSASLNLQGEGYGTHSLQGTGSIRLREADIYQLPLMVQLLKVLSVRPPDATAFDRADMDFRVRGEHIVFDRLDFIGDAVSFYGKGEMDLQRQVRLNFYSLVGRSELNLPLIRNLVGEASQHILQIHMTGPLENPKITREAFPGVNEVLSRLQNPAPRRIPPTRNGRPDASRPPLGRPTPPR